MTVKRQLSRGCFYVLEAVARQPGGNHGMIAEIAGTSSGSIYYFRRRLEFYGLVSVLSGRMWLTEKGKIALAIRHGQQQKQRAKKAARHGSHHLAESARVGAN